jgi:histidinol phosphatase-like enzyme
MSKFFINFLESSGVVSSDDEGQDLPGLEEAKAAAMMSARELLADRVRHASRHPMVAVVITNQDGVELARIAAKDVLPEPLK